MAVVPPFGGAWPELVEGLRACPEFAEGINSSGNPVVTEL